MEITLDYTRKLLARQRSRRESDKLSDRQVRILGDALLPTLRQVLLEMPDEGDDHVACCMLWRIETTRAIDQLVEIVQRGRPQARRWSLLFLWTFLVFEPGPDGMWCEGDWIEFPRTTRRSRKLAPLYHHLKEHPTLKDALFAFRHSSNEVECSVFSNVCVQLRWKDGLPYMREMIGLVDAWHATQIRKDCRTLERSV